MIEHVLESCTSRQQVRRGGEIPWNDGNSGRQNSCHANVWYALPYTARTTITVPNTTPPAGVAQAGGGTTRTEERGGGAGIVRTDALCLTFRLDEGRERPRCSAGRCLQSRRRTLTYPIPYPPVLGCASPSDERTNIHTWNQHGNRMTESLISSPTSKSIFHINIESTSTKSWVHLTRE